MIAVSFIIHTMIMLNSISHPHSEKKNKPRITRLKIRYLQIWWFDHHSPTKRKKHGQLGYPPFSYTTNYQIKLVIHPIISPSISPVRILYIYIYVYNKTYNNNDNSDNNNNNDNNLNNNNTNNNSNNNKYFYIYNILCLVKFLYCQWLGQTFPTHPDIIFLANWLQVPLQ